MLLGFFFLCSPLPPPGPVRVGWRDVRFTNNVNHTEDFEQQFTAQQSYDSTLSLNSVQEDLVTKMIEDICQQIFNATVANW